MLGSREPDGSLARAVARSAHVAACSRRRRSRDHLARAGDDRDAVRDGRRRSHRRRQQLRPVSAGGRAAAAGSAGCSIPNVERLLSLRPDLVIVYDTQTDLKQQLERAQIPMFRYVHRGLPDITETMRALGERVGVEGRSRRRAPVASSSSSRPSARAWRDGRSRKRCWSSAATGRAAPHRRQRRATDFFTTCWNSPAAATCSAISNSSRWT